MGGAACFSPNCRPSLGASSSLVAPPWSAMGAELLRGLGAEIAALVFPTGRDLLRAELARRGREDC